MKAKRILFYGLMFLPLAMALITLQFLPDQVPAHYNFKNQVTRWGSKYETLILPIFTVLFGYFFLGMAKYSARHEENGNNNEKACIVAGIASLALFNAITVLALYSGFHKIENLSSDTFDVYSFVFGILGIVMMITGNIMTKLRMNSVAGLRTRWSMQNESTWKKSQRFGGISFILGGAVIVVICLFAKGIYCFLSAMGVLAILLAIDVFYTYKIASACGTQPGR